MEIETLIAMLNEEIEYLEEKLSCIRETWGARYSPEYRDYYMQYMQTIKIKEWITDENYRYGQEDEKD